MKKEKLCEGFGIKTGFKELEATEFGIQTARNSQASASRKKVWYMNKEKSSEPITMELLLLFCSPT